MTKADLFRVILKVMGLYLLGTVVFYASSTLILLLQGPSFLSFLLGAVVVIVLIALFASFVFKPDFYIRLLKLDKGFDDELSEKVSFRFEETIKTAVIIIGLWLLVKHLPLFITKLIFLIKLLVNDLSDITWQMQTSVLKDYISWGNLVFGLIIGFLMVTKYGQIATFILKKDINLKNDLENG